MPHSAQPHPFLEGGGEMGELTRKFDWSGTVVGSPENWTQSLRVTVSNLLRSGFPMFLWWGKEMVQFYNDAYRPSLGVNGKHPTALGQKGEECWGEIWHIISPFHRHVEKTGKPTWSEDQLVPIYRNGLIENVYWTFSYSAVLDDSGEHGGILVTCIETTRQVISNRNLLGSDSRLRFSLNAGHLGTWQLNLKTFELKTSDIVKQIFGHTPETAFGYDLLRSAMHPGDKIRHEETLKAAIATGADYDLEYQVNWPDGSEHWVNAIGQLQYDEDHVPDFITGVCLDISKRKTEEKNIRDSAFRFRNVIEKAPIAMGLTRGNDLVFDSINELMLQIIRKKGKQEVIGQQLKDVLPELVNQPLFGNILRVLKTGETFQGTEIEAELTNNNIPERRFFNFTYTRIEGVGGELSVLHVATDVTTEVMTRRKIEESEAKLRSIINSAPTAMGVFVGDELIVENPNQLLIEVMAAGPDIEGKSFRKLLSGLVEEDQKFIQIIDSVRSTGKSFEAREIQVFFKAGKRIRYFNINFIPLFDENGKVYAVLDVSVDVTEQVQVHRKLEENKAELATALEQARLSKEAAELGTFDMDLRRNTLHWDERCRALFGISHQEPVTFEKDFVEGLHPGDRDRILAVIQKTFQKKISDGDYDVEYRTIGVENGPERWIKAKGKVYFDELDSPTRFIGSVLDITAQIAAIQKIEHTVEERTLELAKANERLQLTNKELQRSNQSLEEFAHAASHDLKEPIRKIRFFSQQLREKISPGSKEEHAGAFKRIDDATDRMGNLIDDLLQYSHVSQRPHQKETVNLQENIAKVLEDLELDIEKTQTVIHLDKLPVITGYGWQLQQLFQNLVSNAVKFRKPDVSPVIGISSTGTEENEQRYHVIIVTDNGIGFDQKYSEKIFKMFERLHGKAEYSGTGVGLSIVKKVVENHNGLIDVQSAPGVGTTFRIYLPAD